MTNPVVEQLVRELVDRTEADASKLAQPSPVRFHTFILINQSKEPLLISISSKADKLAKTVVLSSVTLKNNGDSAHIDARSDEKVIIASKDNPRNQLEMEVANLANQRFEIRSKEGIFIPVPVESP